MKLKLFVSAVSNVFAENRLLKFVVLIIGVAVLYNTYQLEKALKYQRTILVPPGLKEKCEVTAFDVSDSCIEDIARHVAGLAFNYSPGSARGQFDSLLTLFSPESYPEAYRAFYDLADTVVKANVSSAFYLNGKIIVDRANKQAVLEGISRKYKGDAKIEDGVKKFVVGYVINNGQVQLTKIAPQKEGGK